MLNITKNSIIYVLCVAKKATGGTELLHQLVHEINIQGGNAKIVYVDKKKDSNRTPNTFLKYIDEDVIEDEVIDSPENVLILPEILLSEYKKFNKCQKIIWWLSVDNFFFVNGFFNHAKHKGYLRALKHVILDGKRYPKINLTDLKCLHLYQSEYAHLFLKSSGIKEENTFYLSDYLNEEFLDFESNNDYERKNVVLYNPAKGKVFTEQIIAACPNIEWKALCNMTPQEVHTALLSSKLYIDFGNHPGKDRFPREAVISGCCIITGKKGAAKNSIDIPIPQHFKFDEECVDISNIIEMINSCLDNYDLYINEFKAYRAQILNEKQEFQKCVRLLFDL